MPIREAFQQQFIKPFRQNADVRLRPIDHNVKPRWISALLKNSEVTPNVSVALIQELPNRYRVQVSADINKHFEKPYSNLLSMGLLIDTKGNLTGLVKDQIIVYKTIGVNDHDNPDNVYKLIYKINKDNPEVVELIEIHLSEPFGKKPKFKRVKSEKVFQYLKERFSEEGISLEGNWINTAIVYLSKDSGITAEEAIKTTLF